ncbi:methyltransferase domain-containing protein [Heliobacterium undosum]|uniref:Methyltransferase domain-containing protein n=1 Tax=Heliomicrobium undosum TaxID=121734 RepID=A0A845L4A3_9FIRM|nr:class I SAM-dependent methyltransferase [Heliomicrobium undosum]MZP29460.1 methyltransferase domain-containing protein [Heliomicrobium undosum]
MSDWSKLSLEVSEQALRDIEKMDHRLFNIDDEEISGKNEQQIREMIVGEYFARVAAYAGKVASSFLFRSQWSHEPAEWFDHRHHFLYPEKFMTDYTILSLSNVLEKLPLNGTILDLCSGDGWADYHFYRKRASRVTCVELNEAGYKTALRLHGADNIEYRHGDVLTFEPERDAYDVVLIRGAIEHFSREDQQLLFNKAYGALKPGGWFCGDTPAANQSGEKHLHFHINEWRDEAEMRSELSQVFHIVETKSLKSQSLTTLYWQCGK